MPVGRSKAAIVFFLLVVALPLRARADDATDGPKTLAGTWSATSLSESWTTESWGEACGPKPGGQGAPGGTVQVGQQGSELTFSGAGRPFSTAQCWDPSPGLVRTSHSAGARGWSTRCASPKGDPRVATVNSSTTATDDTIVFVETGQYQFVIQDTVCRASASRRRSFKLIQRAGEAPPAPAATAAPTAEPAPPAAPSAPPPEQAPTPRRGCTPGAPTRLEVTPGHKLVRPGDGFELRWQATDAASCAVAVRPRFLVEADEPAVGKAIRADVAGRVTIAEDAPEGTGAILVELEGQSGLERKAARVVVEIATPERFDGLLAERGFGVAGEGDTAVVVIATAVGGSASTARDTSGDRRSAFVAIVLGAGAALALAAFVVLRKNQRKRETERASEAPPAPLVALYQRPAEDEPMRCPTCRDVFPPGSIFCPTDGLPLVPAPRARVTLSRATPSRATPSRATPLPAAVDPAPPPASPSSGPAGGRASGGKVCPTCGGRFDEAATFCGRDGTSLVPVN